MDTIFVIAVIAFVIFHVIWSLLNPDEVKRIAEERGRTDNDMFRNDDTADEIIGAIPGATFSTDDDWYDFHDRISDD